jgi:hypothetical protein
MKPYGDIPPMLNKKRNNKKTRRQKLNNNQRRMSHVEDWIKVDSKESLPDEEDLVKFIYSQYLVTMLIYYIIGTIFAL